MLEVAPELGKRRSGGSSSGGGGGTHLSSSMTMTQANPSPIPDQPPVTLEFPRALPSENIQPNKEETIFKNEEETYRRRCRRRRRRRWWEE